jgi:N-acetylmuramoyl-L-alanine amidase
MIDAFQHAIGARTIWGEARSEGPDGMRAVAHVLLNRCNTGRWGATLAAVCLAPWQFSCWNANDPNRPQLLALRDDDQTLQLCMDALDDALEPGAADPTHGATHYVRDDWPTPDWAKGLQPSAHIGHHLFFAGVK